MFFSPRSATLEPIGDGITVHLYQEGECIRCAIFSTWRGAERVASRWCSYGKTANMRPAAHSS